MDQKRKAYRDKHREQINAQKRAWNAANKDKISVARRKRESTPEYKAKRAEQRRNYTATEDQKIRWTENSRRSARNRKIKAVELLGGVCTICGLKDDPVVYDFHHRDPAEKDLAISKAKTWAAIEMELPKCVLVCANCHRKVHKV